MIVVKINGGLGNQMFQYSFGHYLAKKHNTPVKFEINTIQKNEVYTSRNLDISHFNILINTSTKEDVKRFKLVKTDSFQKYERKISQYLPFLNKKQFIEKPYITNLAKIKFFRDNCYYDGYWQAYSYLDEIRNELLKNFQLNFDLDDEANQILNDINSSNSISIHIRRGDYKLKHNAKIYSNISKTYYNKAIEYFFKNIKNPTFYIFSDDINWVKQNFIGEHFKFVETKSNNPVVDMHLMSLCHHNIIANSTFSWWGAWLNTNETKTVICPKNWLVNTKNNDRLIKNLIYENWIAL
jgi:hypothetical protein